MSAKTEGNALLSMLTGIPRFWKAQQKDWKVTVVRTSIERLGYQIIYPFLSLFIISLGANKTQLGYITSISMLISGLLGPYIGRFIDRNGAKKMYMLGIVGLFASYILYGIAPDWKLCIAAMIVYYFGQSLAGQSCAIICGNCLDTRDRARGMLVCESLTAGLLGMAGPMIASFILVNILGVGEEAATANDYRYLFFVAAAFTFISLFIVIFKLSNTVWSAKQTKQNAIVQGFALIKRNKNARKWILISAIGALPNAMVVPYVQVFASESKLAPVTVLATMVTASALTSTLLGYPVGALADKYGRKKVLYVTISLYWLSIILLMLAPNTFTLILSGILQGFFHITAPLAGAVQRELVGQDEMGVWIGFNKLTSAFASAAFALLAGYAYDHLGAVAVFIIYIAVDALVRVPLLASLPETLHHDASAEA